jgi:hypothetical protein
VSGQLHAPAALPRRKSQRYPLYKRLGGPQSRFGHGEVVYIFIFKPVTLQTTLFRLPQSHVFVHIFIISYMADKYIVRSSHRHKVLQFLSDKKLPKSIVTSVATVRCLQLTKGNKIRISYNYSIAALRSTVKIT